LCSSLLPPPPHPPPPHHHHHCSRSGRGGRRGRLGSASTAPKTPMATGGCDVFTVIRRRPKPIGGAAARAEKKQAASRHWHPQSWATNCNKPAAKPAAMNKEEPNAPIRCSHHTFASCQFRLTSFTVRFHHSLKCLGEAERCALWVCASPVILSL
jgi:hypothetical protein